MSKAGEGVTRQNARGVAPSPGTAWHVHHPRSPFPALEPAGPPAAPDRAKRVLVLGAGMSGLSAAHRLVELGHEVTVLEARGRPGGKVATLRDAFASGLHAEVGATFLPGHHNLTIGYCVRFGLPLRLIDPKRLAITYHVGGRFIERPNAPDAPWPYPVEEKDRGIMALYGAYLLAHLKDIGDPRAPGWPAREVLKKYDSRSMEAFLKEEGASTGAVDVLRLGYLSEFGDGIDAVSALMPLVDLALTYLGTQPHRTPRDGDAAHSSTGGPGDCPPAPDPQYQIASGNDGLPRAFAASPELRGRIRYGHPVTRIEAAGEGVRVTCDVPGANATFDADRVVCTIPFSVLREAVDIALPLSEGKRRAIATLRYTSSTRVYVQCAERVWYDDPGSGIVNTDLPVGILQDQTLTQPGPQGILESYTTGPLARRFDAMSEGDRLTDVSRSFVDMLPALAGKVEGGASKSWDLDPWAKGDWPWYAPGEMATVMPDVASPEPPLHFAGEHTSRLPGWIQGALESAHRVVQEIHGS